eukprot:5110960-Amphidinium_carterae.6
MHISFINTVRKVSFSGGVASRSGCHLGSRAASKPLTFSLRQSAMSTRIIICLLDSPTIEHNSCTLEVCAPATFVLGHQLFQRLIMSFIPGTEA